MIWLLGLLCIGLLIALGVMALRIDRANHEAMAANESEQSAREELEPLRRYEGIRDIQTAEQNIIKKSQAVQEEIREKTQAIKDYAKNLDALNKVLQRSVEGYGDEYLVPSVTLLDELADEYSFDATGRALKEAAKKRKELAKKGKASKSLTGVSPTAEQLLVKAFTLQADSELKKTKSANYGVLTKKIEDAFEIMNEYGSAIGVQITKKYLTAYLEELKWAVNTHILKEKDKEEQRRLRALEKEDKEALREAKLAEKKADREEELVTKAMEAHAMKFEADMQTLRDATDAERESAQRSHQQEIERLQEQMRNIEEDRERAKSMAQLTRSGHVYVISNIGSFGEGVYKVGMTRRLEPMGRVKELGDASVPFPFDVHAMINTEDAPSLEKELHNALEDRRVNLVNLRKEFFRVPLEEIRTILISKGADVHWTIRAEAAHYRETRVLQGLVQGNEESALSADTTLDAATTENPDLLAQS